jgi:diguanylate cyclase (GGDEF)-like protein
MTKNYSMKIGYIHIVFSVVFYLMGTYLYTLYSLEVEENEAIYKVDERLKSGAYAIRYLLGDDFLMRATHANSITSEEDWVNIRGLSALTENTELAFLYAAIKKKDEIYVIASSATQEELNSKTELHYFHHYVSAPAELFSVFESGNSKALEYEDQWGHFRGLFIPVKLNDGHTVVLVAEVDLKEVDDLRKNVTIETYAQGLIHLLLLVPLLISIVYLLWKENIRLQKLLHTDSLTKLSNRLFLSEYLEDTLSTKTSRQKNIALLYIDIDDLKEINDGFNHLVGDAAISVTSKRLNEAVGKDHILVRYQGDQFIVLIFYGNKFNSISDTAKTLLDLFVKPIDVMGYQFYISCSIGISLFPKSAKNSSELIQFADMAMRKVKRDGKKGYCFFTPEIKEACDKKSALRLNIIEGVNQSEFFLVYQPQYNAITNSVIGLEALLRWKHPKKGLISPDVFIPYAEDSGLIIDIGNFVLESAISKASELRKANILGDIKIAINISPLQLYQVNFIEIVNHLLMKYECKPDSLKFEITEQFIMKNQSASISKLHEIKNMGIEISIDDFGTGYSSLSYLKDLPVDQLKIDRSFITNIAKDKQNQAIVESVIGLCKGMNLSVLAEGAETKEEVDFLAGVGCEQNQGFYFSKPLDEDSIFDLLNRITNKDM